MRNGMIADAVERYLEQKGYERMALKAAMFDMDGVLFDSMKNHGLDEESCEKLA